MTIKKWLEKAQEKLINTGVETPRLDAEVILADVLKVDRSWLLAHDDDLQGASLLQGVSLQKANRMLERRINHEPVAYILGYKEFYGREFLVDNRVLVPRPETEQIIEEFKKLKLPKNAVVADIGCGSGALAVTAKLEKPSIQIKLLDIDENVFITAKKNARNHKIQAQYYQGDLLEAWPIYYDVLLCNLPYVPDKYPVNKSTEFEPRVALYSGADGLNHYRRLFYQLSNEKYGSPIVIVESLLQQHEKLAKIAKLAGYKLTSEKDLVQVFEQAQSTRQEHSDRH